MSWQKTRVIFQKLNAQESLYESIFNSLSTQGHAHILFKLLFLFFFFSNNRIHTTLPVNLKFR